ncbi:hypothetical protein E1B28_011168 [Marasmius oreades]|uniref:Uncharacterized protein n=1 Tax=Marasmius oreades TaxID=181124 RepID=A0A9P7RUW6_9AGAR|nr:uncharacterized protein E1B28_011168 [Marasmius oreades]KAG7089488.1 hypothetical protein E1B28_011168 [Marasmius oreades]
MFATFITVALFAAASVQNVLADYTLATPSLTQCQDAAITWEGAKGPVNIIAVPASDACNGNILADLGDHDGNSYTWKVDVPAGTKLVLTSLDTEDVEAWSGEITVQPSDDDSCVRAEFKTASSASSSASSTASSSEAAGTLVVTPTKAASSSSSTGSTGSTGNSNGPVGGVANDPYTSSNGALRQTTTPVLILGAIGAVLAASL